MGRRQDWALWDLKLVIVIAVAVALLLPPLPSTADWIVEKEEPCISHGTMFNLDLLAFLLYRRFCYCIHQRRDAFTNILPTIFIRPFAIILSFNSLPHVIMEALKSSKRPFYFFPLLIEKTSVLPR